jgi:hypothetical protein
LPRDAGRPVVMSKALSADLRERVVAVIAGGASRQAAARSGRAPIERDPLGAAGAQGRGTHPP